MSSDGNLAFDWNPYRWCWEDYEEDCEVTSKETPQPFGWSCHSKKPKADDEFFLMKLGQLPRGIIAHGIIKEDIFQDEHWDEDKAGEQTNYITGECDTLLNYKTEYILNFSVLDRECPQQYWHPQSSGIRIKDEVLPKLHELWEDVIAEYPDNPEESAYCEATGGILEGTKKAVYTTTYERNPKVRRAFLKGKALKCEVCGFNFEKVYGALGAGYIESPSQKTCVRR